MRELGTRDERILVVEDEEPIRDLVTTALRFTGFTVETAATGLEGLTLVRNDAWHVLVLDVNLPGLDGFSLCRKLREAGDEVPVIFAWRGWWTISFCWLAPIRGDHWRKSR